MLRRKFFLAGLLIILCGMAGVIQTVAADAEKININTATAEELMQLNGVGPKYAAEIIAYRESYGPFETPEELMQVSGIGPKTFEKNQEVLPWGNQTDTIMITWSLVPVLGEASQP